MKNLVLIVGPTGTHKIKLAESFRNYEHHEVCYQLSNYDRRKIRDDVSQSKPMTLITTDEYNVDVQYVTRLARENGYKILRIQTTLYWGDEYEN